MENLNNSYIQVPKSLFDEIQEMKKRQEEIPHYRAQVKSIEGFEKLTTEEKLLLAKYNADEVKKQYRNEDEKGMINSCYNHYYDNRKAHVLPIIADLFDVEGLSKFLNSTVEKAVNEQYKGDKQRIYDMNILKRIRFIDADIEKYIVDTIADAEDVTKCKFLYQVYVNKYSEMKEPTGCMFWFQSDRKISIFDCSTSSRTSQSFENTEEAVDYWENHVGSSSFPLMGWKKYGFM